MEVEEEAAAAASWRWKWSPRRWPPRFAAERDRVSDEEEEGGDLSRRNPAPRRSDGQGAPGNRASSELLVTNG